jgi:hypothetical protein
MLTFIVLSILWIRLGIVGQKLLFRKGYEFDGLDAIRDYQRDTGGPLTRVGTRPSGVVVVGGPITLLVGLLIRPKQRTLPASLLSPLRAAPDHPRSVPRAGALRFWASL